MLQSNKWVKKNIWLIKKKVNKVVYKTKKDLG